MSPARFPSQARDSRRRNESRSARSRARCVPAIPVQAARALRRQSSRRVQALRRQACGISPAESPARLCPEAGSTIWHAAVWRSLPVANSDGLFALHRLSANAQRVWKRQPDGGLIGLGGSPAIGASLVGLSGSSEGIARGTARV